MKELREVLLERLSLIDQLFIDYQNNPYDPERAHQLRVHTRELRAVINFFKKDMPEEVYLHLKESLKEIAQLYGPMREMDVLNDYISRVALENPDLSDAYYDLFRRLGNERREEMRKTMEDEQVERVETLLEEVKEQIESLELELDKDLDAYINKKLKKKGKKLKAAYEEVDYDHYEETHQVRIEAKRVRYVAAILQKLTSQNLSKHNKKAKKIQNELGVIVDNHVNQELLTAFAEKVNDEEIRKLIKEIQELEA